MKRREKGELEKRSEEEEEEEEGDGKYTRRRKNSWVFPQEEEPNIARRETLA